MQPCQLRCKGLESLDLDLRSSAGAAITALLLQLFSEAQVHLVAKSLEDLETELQNCRSGEGDVVHT